IELGEIAPIETASEELTDEFLLLAIDSGLLKSWAGSFPDPRCEPEIAMEVILPAPIAARFAGLDSMRTAGYVLRSARVLGALGSSVEVIEPARGLSVRGTSDDKLWSGDVVRKLLVQMEQHAELSQPIRRLSQEPSVAVKVRERASRRGVKQAVEDAEAEARAHQGAAHLMHWDNQQVGVSMLQYARLGRGRRRPILDTTPVEVPLETGTYEGRGVVKNEDGTLSRGYKLAPWRTRLASAGLRRPVCGRRWPWRRCRGRIWPWAVPCWRRRRGCGLGLCSSKLEAFSMGRRYPRASAHARSMPSSRSKPICWRRRRPCNWPRWPTS